MGFSRLCRGATQHDQTNGLAFYMGVSGLGQQVNEYSQLSDGMEMGLELSGCCLLTAAAKCTQDGAWLPLWACSWCCTAGLCTEKCKACITVTCCRSDQLQDLCAMRGGEETPWLLSERKEEDSSEGGVEGRERGRWKREREGVKLDL